MTNPDSTSCCRCGCGQLAPVATKTDSKRGVRKGDRLLYKRGHHNHRNPKYRCGCGCGLSKTECSTAKAAEHRQWWEATYPTISYGKCCCGCGQSTPTAPYTTATRNWIQDQPKPFLHGHNAPVEPKTTYGVNQNDGFCECGCGEPATTASQSVTMFGWARGKPRRFLKGHYPKYLSRILRSEAYIVNRLTGCWVWQLSRDSCGYGMVWHEGVSWRAHRLSYTIAKGPIPEGTELDHLCNNRACVSPEHLEAVTHTENIRRGAHSKLTMTDAREIRLMYATGRYKRTDLAAFYGVHEGTIGSVLRGETWTEQRM